MGLPFLRSYLHGLYIIALIAVIITISPSEAACCQDNNNHCGAALSSLCESSNLLPDSLYICEEGGDPSPIQICLDGCQTHVGGNDICKHVLVDNKTASQLLPETALKRGQSLFSPDKKTKLSMQMNGDLVVSIIGGDLTEKSVWSTGTSSLARPPVSVSLLQNGDLVMVNDEGETAWRLGTSGTKYAGASLWVRNGGLICLANEPDGDCLWKSVTVVTSTQSAVLIPGRSVGYTWSVGRLHVTDVAEFSYSNNQARDAILQQILGVWNTALGSANSGGLRIDFVSQILSGNGGFIVTYSITGTTGKLTVTPKQLVDLVHTSISASRVVGVKIPSPNKKNLAFV